MFRYEKFDENETNKPHFIDYNGPLHFYSNEANNFGFGLRYYIKFNKCNQGLTIGTMGSYNQDFNRYVHVQRHPNWNFGDTITMTLDCDRNSLTFVHNHENVIGGRIRHKQFQNGNISILRNQVYFPAISSLGCSCQGVAKGFVLDVTTS